MTKSMSIRVRAVRPTEYALAGELVVEAYRTLGDAGDPAYERHLRDVAARVEDSDVLVAELEGRIVGCVTFVDRLKPLSEVEDSDAATIRMLGVATDARGAGVGAALVRECIERAQHDGCRRVRLDTRTSMTGAQRLYERFGFRRDPEHDWSPAPGVMLMSYVLELARPGAER
jgi:ribosomal protein S18 acetylase RimI-like enzyme